MKKILFVQLNLQPPGGGRAVAAWILEALKKDYAVSLLTWKPPDFEEVNRSYGTSLDKSSITVHCINPILCGLISLDPDPSSIQSACYLYRVCKRMSKNYDIIITAEYESDFGVKGIQYIHYPSFHHLYATPRPGPDLPWYGKLWAFCKGYYRPWMLVSGYSFDRMKENLTLVNSDWTGRETKRIYGIETTTVYPPVQGAFPEVPWEERESGFICIGRLDPIKRFERIIEIITKVNKKVPNLRLHIVGTCDPKPAGYSYYRKIRALAEANSSWITFHEDLSREEIIRLLTHLRYGINGYENEQFGIAVAEMINADCIPFVPNNGGQVEIVGGDKRLLYGTVEEAVEKIIRVMENPAEQASIRHYLNSRKELFSIERFVSQIRDIINRF